MAAAGDIQATIRIYPTCERVTRAYRQTTTVQSSERFSSAYKRKIDDVIVSFKGFGLHDVVNTAWNTVDQLTSNSKDFRYEKLMDETDFEPNFQMYLNFEVWITLNGVTAISRSRTWVRTVDAEPTHAELFAFVKQNFGELTADHVARQLPLEVIQEKIPESAHHLLLHLDASKRETVLATSVKVAENGEAVFLWANCARNGPPDSDAKQPDRAKQPILHLPRPGSSDFAFLRSGSNPIFMRGDLKLPPYKTFIAVFRDIGSDNNCIHPVLDANFNGIGSAPEKEGPAKYVAADGHGHIAQGKAHIERQWCVGAATYDQDGSSVYLNGELGGRDLDRANHPRDAAFYFLASREDGHGRSFVGDIAEVLVFDVCLDSNTIRDLSQSLCSKYGFNDKCPTCGVRRRRNPTPESDALVHKPFPGALGNFRVLELLQPILERLGMDADNTLFSHSTCPDEINHELDDITDVLNGFFGEMFLMGGLAGIPFAGKTGFGAFSHHVPENGNIFILFAPHVAVNGESGRVGYYSRLGMEHESTACGAAIGAYTAVKDTGAALAVLAEDDFQMDFIKRELFRHLGFIQGFPDAMVGVAHAMFKVVETALLKILDFHWTKGFTAGGKIVLLGGLQINMDSGHPDYFLPLVLSLREEGKEPVNLLPELTGGPK